MDGILRRIAASLRLVRSDDGPEAYIVSYPKTGRTWLRLLLGHVVCEQFGVPRVQLLETRKITRHTTMCHTTFTHDGAGLKEHHTAAEMICSKAKYATKRVVLLVRDPRDTLVSCYFQATKRNHVYEGSISDFIRSDLFGAEKCVQFYSNWARNWHVPARTLLVRYEDMHQNTRDVLRTVLQFIDAADVPDALVEAAVEFARFENMKQMESKKRFDWKVMRPGDQSDRESFKVRKGKVGGYAEYLDESDAAYVADLVARSGCPFFEPYRPPMTRLAA